MCVDGRLLLSVFRHLAKARTCSNMGGVRGIGELEILTSYKLLPKRESI